MNPHPLLRRFGHALWRDWLRPLAVPLLLVAGAKSALADINYVPSGSMQPTILPGDVVFINKLAYDLRVPFTSTRLARWSAPERGDIVVCFAPDDGTRLVKRVVAVPGDWVELSNDVLQVNGVPRRYESRPTPVPAALGFVESDGARQHAIWVRPGAPALRTFAPLRVPPGHVFVLGDDRDNSKDSRYFGPVPVRSVMGEAKGVFVSADLERWLKPRFGRFFSALE